jgi:hypothetical protein
MSWIDAWEEAWREFKTTPLFSSVPPFALRCNKCFCQPLQAIRKCLWCGGTGLHPMPLEEFYAKLF